MACSILIRLDEGLKRSIVKAARGEDRSMSSWIRCAIRRALQEAEREQRDRQ